VQDSFPVDTDTLTAWPRFDGAILKDSYLGEADGLPRRHGFCRTATA
jgi:hypothetical protein